MIHSMPVGFGRGCVLGGLLTALYGAHDEVKDLKRKEENVQLLIPRPN